MAIKQTLLEIVQEILSDMDSDEVNSIDDTAEAGQVALIVQGTYTAMLSSRDWPHTKRIINLVASTDSNFPNYMTYQEDVKEMISIFYDKHQNTDNRLKYEEVKWLEPDNFLRYTNARDSAATSTLIVTDPSGVKMLIANNKAPTYYTSFDDTTIIFDSYDSVVENTLQSNKTQARAYIFPEFSISDDFVPDLPPEAFSALVEEAKSKAMFRLKSVNDTKAEQESVRQQRWLARKSWTVNGGIQFPDYGRHRSRTAVKDPTFRNEN